MRFRITIDGITSKGVDAEPYEVFEVEIADPRPEEDPEGVAVEQEAGRIRAAVVERFGAALTLMEESDLRIAEGDRRHAARMAAT